MFSDKPTVRAHVDYMLNKARKKLWILRHVRKAGLSTGDLLNTFNTFIRPVLEFAAPTYHPMLTLEMLDEIEGIQKRASKLIFGWNTHYDEIIESGKMELLDNGREKLTVNFARKTAKQERFTDWFEEKKYNGLNLRHEKKYEEKFARTERLKKSPLYHMRRKLNED